MNHDDTLQRFQQAEDLIGKMVEALPKETIAEAARLLAMNVAHYKRLHGDVSINETMRVLQSVDEGGQRISDEALALIVEGLEEFAGILSMLMQQDIEMPDLH